MLLHGLRIIYGSGIRTGVLLKLRVPYVEISISVGTEYKIQYTNKNISFQVSTKTNVARQKVAHVLDTAIRPIHDLTQYLKKQNTVKCYLGTFLPALSDGDNHCQMRHNAQAYSADQSAVQSLLKKIKEIEIEGVVNSSSHTQLKALSSARNFFITEQ